MIQPPDADGMVQITPNTRVPRQRAIEWMQGIRPLDGMDADSFFQSCVETGLITREQWLELHKRHEFLTRQEAAAADGDLVCQTCQGSPPEGFACRTCGTTA